MTREEALQILDTIPTISEQVDALEMAIQALSQEPCDDAIDREELLKAIDTWDKFGYTETGCFVREPKGDYVPYIHYDDVIKSIKGMSSVTQKSGKWDRSCTCSVCGQWRILESEKNGGKYKFCPNCGAKMVEPQESEDKEVQ